MPNLYALLVGINNYPINKLNGCIDDALKIESYLNTLNKSGIDVIKTNKFFDQEATNINSDKNLDDIIANLKDDNVFLFYYSGHNARERSR